ncbi:hypothetical protein BC628DRAFT_1538167 [Trametes gibbosa]|nr:hypothetical protein BC628DRAFT_1538167 [Trametes gibbosa]
MATNGLAAGKYACKCLNIRIQALHTPSTSPTVEAGFTAVYVGDEGIRVAHTEVTLRSRSKPVPDVDSPAGELSRYTSITCLVCGLPTYRVAQRITPDLINEVGPVLPTDDWVEKELLKSSSGWIEVYNGCLTDDELAQAEKSCMYSDMFSIVLPGPKSSSPAGDTTPTVIPNARGPSEQGKKHLPELPALFLPPPFTPAHIVFAHFSSLATERSQRIRDEAEEYIAQVTQQKVAEVLKAETALKQEVHLVWGKFRGALQLLEENGTSNKAGLPVRRRGSVPGHARTVSSPVPGTSASVRINSFVPTPGHPQRTPSHHRTNTLSALSASLKVSGFHYPEPQRQTNGNTSPARRSVDLTRTSPTRSDRTRVNSPSTASSRTMALSVDLEASIREAYRREMDESKDIATSFRYVMDIESQMEQHRLEEEAEEASVPVASTSQVVTEATTTAGSRGRSPRVQKSAFRHSQPAGGSQPVPNADGANVADALENKETNGKGKRKVTFDVQPEVAIIKDDGEAGGTSEHAVSSSAYEDPIFDMDNETEHSATTRIDVSAEPPKASPAPSERSRTPTRQSHSRSSSNSGLPQMLSSLRPASLPVPSAMRPPLRHSGTESAERTRSLRESLLAVESHSTRPDAIDNPIEIKPPSDEEDEEEADPREAEIMRLVAASVPSHRSGWKKNSKSWQMFLSRRERKASEVEQDAISEEGNYAVLDDFDAQPHRNGFNGVADSDVTDEDEDDDKWANGDHQIAQSLPIPIGPLGQHRQTFGIPSYQPKTSLSDRPGMLVPPLRNGSTSYRRPSVRALDPGALDFAVDEDGVDDVESDPETGGKARQRALKILKARDELPAAGMWRSLA